MTPKPIVFVVDADVAVRESLQLLIDRSSWQPKMFASATEFLAQPRVPAPSCMVLDVALPGLSGLHLQTLVADRSREALAREAAMKPLRESYASLSRREREVMALVVSGLLNKQVGGELGISEITVKAHRGQVMRKMQADSLPALVRMAGRLDVSAARSAEPVRPVGLTAYGQLSL